MRLTSLAARMFSSVFLIGAALFLILFSFGFSPTGTFSSAEAALHSYTIVNEYMSLVDSGMTLIGVYADSQKVCNLEEDAKITENLQFEVLYSR